MIFIHLAIWFALLCLYIKLRGGLSNVARKRLYKSGTGWCAWRWADVDSEYILRLHIVKTPWFAVCLHWIRKPDAEPWLHDHPVSFLSVILRGKYAELRRDGVGEPYIRVNRWFNFVRANRTDRHRIVFCRANTLTLCFMGAKVQEWGFYMPPGWLFWKDYYARLRAGEKMRGGGMAVLEYAAQIAHDNAKALMHGTLSFVDEDKRLIDNGRADPACYDGFDEEAPTEPRK